METDWTEKYRPSSLSDVLGNNKAVNTLMRWAREWKFGIPGKRAVILAGSPGIGKTSAALALARDMGWGVIELNASDVRSGENIRNIATRGALFDTFTDTGEFKRASKGGRKLIILDEADNLYERPSGGQGKDRQGTDFSDRGGKTAITQTIKITMQPIILIVNDLYALTRNSPLKTLCETIKFQKIRAQTIEKALIRIIRNEGLEVEREALDILAKRADGDLRAAINDLQALSRMGTRITKEMAGGMGFRDNVITLQDALTKILKGDSTDVRRTAWDLDETPDSLLTWLDENLPYEYKDPVDLMNGYDALSRADVYLGRVRRRQYYRLWAYANDMMTAGVALAKKREYHHFIRYRFPGWILKMSHTKGMRRRRNELARKIGAMCHTSIKDARLELLPIVQTLFRQSEHTDYDFAINMTNRLSLLPEEIAFLLGTVTDDARIGEIQEMAIEHHREATGFFPSQMKTKKATAAGFDLKKKKVTKTGKKKSTRKEKDSKGKAKKDGTETSKGKAKKDETETSKGKAKKDGTETSKGKVKKDEKREKSPEASAGEEIEEDGADRLEGGKVLGSEESSEVAAAREEKEKKKPMKKPKPRPEKAWF